MKRKRLPAISAIFLIFLISFGTVAFAQQVEVEAGKQYTFEIPTNLTDVVAVKWYKGGYSVQERDSGVPDYNKYYYTASAADNNAELYFIAIDSKGNQIHSDVWVLHVSSPGQEQTQQAATPVPSSDVAGEKPKITKSPTGETVNVGGEAKFVARAENYITYTWRIVSSDTKSTVKATEAEYYFPGVHVSGADTECLVLSNIPASMDGWIIECMFSNINGSSFSSGAKLAVLSQPFQSPEPSPDAAVQPSPEASADPNPEAAPSAEELPEEHIHKSTLAWYSDDHNHWQLCECGEELEKGEHDIDWIVQTEPTRRKNGISLGICKICGVEQTKIVSPTASPAPANIIMIIVLITLILGIVGVIVMLSVYFKNSQGKYSYQVYVDDDGDDYDETNEGTQY